MSHLVFAVNNEIYRVLHPDPSERLVDYLRRETGYTSTKIGCGEGGCGACAVLLQDTPNGKMYTANACLVPLCLMHGKSITTTEGLGNSTTGFHPVQDRVAEFNGTQCGYCTPGMVMAIYGQLEKSNGTPDVQEMESCLDGNLCRCTGYRPLLDAAKSFATQITDHVGIVGSKISSGPLSTEEFNSRRPTFPQGLVKAAAAADVACKGQDGVPRWSSYGKSWFTPSTVEDVLTAMQATNAYKLIGGNTSVGVYKRNVSNPSTLIDLSRVKQLHAIEALEGHCGISFGGSVTINNAIQALVDMQATNPVNAGVVQMIVEHMNKIAGQHVRGVGTLSGNIMMVKQWGFSSDLATVLMAAEAKIKCHLKMDNQPVKTDVLSLEDFFALATNDILIVGIDLPLPAAGATSQGKASTLMKTYKVALRPQNSHALVNAGFKVTIKQDQTTLKHTIASAVVVYGAVNDLYPIRAPGVEQLMVGRECGNSGNSRNSTMNEALFTKLEEEILVAYTPNSINSSSLPEEDTKASHSSEHEQKSLHPTHDIHRVAHRQRLVVNLLQKFLDDLDQYSGESSSSSAAAAAAAAAAVAATTVAGSPSGYRRDISRGTQLLPGLVKDGADEGQHWFEHVPVSMPVPKLTARLSASGEAKFTADMPKPARAAYCSFGQAYQTGQVVVNVSTERAAAMPGVLRIITYKDIPGVNNGSCTSPERLLVDFNGDPVNYSGEPCCIVVADTDQHARNAAASIEVIYAANAPTDAPPAPSTATSAPVAEAPADQKQIDRPLIHVEDADAQGGMAMKRSESSAHLERHDNGFATVDEALDNLAKDSSIAIVRGELKCGPQKHFPMETQTALAIPDEGGKMVVWSSMQYPAGVQDSVARVIFKEGKEADRTLVTAKCRRVGGGFGAKLSRHTPAACAAALAAKLCRRPVLMSLDRNTDMEMTGGRHDVVGTYSFGVNTTTGKIHALKVKIILDVGWSPDISGFCVMALARAIEQTYYFPELDIDVFPVFTHTPSRTAMRGPSEIEASFIAETVLAHAAHAARRTPDDMRELNLFPMDKLINVDGTGIPISEWTIPRLWEELKTTSKYEERKQHIKVFNAKHIGRRYRGIAMTTVKYAVGANYRSALVNIHADGSIQLTHGGCEMGQGINTKVAQAAAYVLQKVLLDDGKEEKEEKEGRDGETKQEGGAKGRSGHSNYYPRSVLNATMGPLLRRVHISDTSTEKLPNMGMTGGSTTSEACCGAVMLACTELVNRLLPVREDLIKAGKPCGWDDIVKAANSNKINLGSQKAWRRGLKKFANDEKEKEQHKYVCFGVACSEVEIDCLTGESTILRVDIMYDCGKPLNPSIDLGQIEGGFVCGLGFFFREQVQRNEQTGATWNHGTWEYKPPCSMDVPIDMRVSYLGNAKHEAFVLSSKASGEPPLVLSTSAFMALRECIASARKDNGLGEDFFQLNAPALVDDIASACVGDALN